MTCEEFIGKFDHYKAVRKQKKLFGTFGFRGIVNEGIGADKVRQVGAALALYLSKGKTVAIGKDPRVSSDMLEDALIGGIVDYGCNALTLGIITPNGLSLEVGKQADAGVMITASHNPPEYNGIKCLGKSGRGFSPDEDIALEKIYFSGMKKPADKGKRLVDSGAAGRYRDYIVSYAQRFSQKPMKIVVDGGAGSASMVTPETLERLGHDIVRFNCKYDGLFTVRNPEPTDANLVKLKELVVEEGAAFGVAHDGDGDRTAFVDEKGGFIQGDVSAAIIADHVLRENKDKKKIIAVTIAYSNLIEDVAKNLGAEVIYTPVGEPYLAQAKLYCGAQVGLEEHGSVLLGWSREGAMLAGVMAGILSKEGKTMSELVSSYPKYYQIKDAKTLPAGTDINALMERLEHEIPQDYKRLTDIDGVRVNYPTGWFLVRASGTEPKLRVFSEGVTEEKARKFNRVAMEGLERAIYA
ncbi:MAG: hypothetical protein IBX39_07570 [Candidatus Methanoperedenaceae archaeon]|nr:hypothetical protein [Candidatus Methanoperedenaceae archaeon]